MAVQGTPLVDTYLPSPTGVDDRITAHLANEFPTPPSAQGYLIDPELNLQYDALTSINVSGIFLAGALTPESWYLEPTTGQIWPR